MIEIVWRLEHEVLDSERVVGPLLDAICGVPGFVAAFYDVNGREQWRGFERVHAVVDALTQRTQWLRIASVDRVNLAMVAMGKHGEVPAMMMQLASFEMGGIDELTTDWGAMFETVGVAFGSLSSAAWRGALVDAGVAVREEGESVAMVQAWGAGAEPKNFGAIVEIVDRCAAMRRYRRGALEVLVLGDQEKIVDEEHAVALEKVCALLIS